MTRDFALAIAPYVVGVYVGITILVGVLNHSAERAVRRYEVRRADTLAPSYEQYPWGLALAIMSGKYSRLPDPELARRVRWARTACWIWVFGFLLCLGFVVIGSKR